MSGRRVSDARRERPYRDVQLLPDDLRSRLESHLARRTAALLDVGGGDCRTTGPFGRMVCDFAVDGSGKRIRPQLVLWAVERCGGDPASDVALDAACGWELFHAFLLVHDDIIDAAADRRSRPSLHRRLASLDGNSATFGVNLGIVAGDLLFAAAMRLWHAAADDARVSAGVARRLLGLTSRIALRTGVGQAADISIGHAPLQEVTERQVLDAYHAKTAAYTFEGPLLTGAILSDCASEALAAVTDYATALGQAYQIHNDLLDLDADPHVGSDLLEGKRTLPLVLAFASADAEGRRTLQRHLERAADTSLTHEDRLSESAHLREALIRYGGVEAAGQVMRRLLDAASDAADPEWLPQRLASGLQDLLSSLRCDYFSRGMGNHLIASDKAATASAGP